MNKRLKTFLMISVASNALLIGIVLGELSYSFSSYFVQNAATMPSSPDCCASSPEKQLPDAKRKLFEDIMHPAWEKMQATRAKIDNEKKKALSLLKAEPFDEKAYRSQVQHIADMHAQIRRDMTAAVTKLARQFTPQERAILADIIAHPPLSAPPQPR